jgi:hypothetical protein
MLALQFATGFDSCQGHSYGKSCVGRRHRPCGPGASRLPPCWKGGSCAVLGCSIAKTAFRKKVGIVRSGQVRSGILLGQSLGP